MKRSGARLLLSSLLAGTILLFMACRADESDLRQPDSTIPAELSGESDEVGASASAEYVKSGVCRDCHPGEFQAWSGSHHDRAMETATAESVLGDFNDSSFEEEGVSWRFFKRDESYFVHTVGEDGVPADFEIVYTFGIDPLQQYLVKLSKGRMQALTVAWDTRSEAAGGQRWFSLHPGEAIPPGDVLHWTGIANRWNAMCAECHSTNVRKNFDLAEARYDTRMSEVDVACEACHGPGSLHVAWAKAGADPATNGRGLLEPLVSRGDARWTMNPETGIAFLSNPRSEDAEIERCAGCHSRRSVISEAGEGERFLDRHIPALLDEGLYFADGQIQDEVYVYGSFLQSRMYHAGVRCGDCHEPHSLELRESGHALCAQCHAPSRFDVRSHHRHSPESAGARCVECHMPSRTYMVVDDRRDHSFRIPRPDLSDQLGTPNACNRCHSDRDAKWATSKIASGSSGGEAPSSHYGSALHAGRIGAVEAPARLLELALDDASPAIVRATGLSMLSRYPGAESSDAIRAAAAADEPLLRLAAARAADSFPIDARARLIGPLMQDRIRSIRIEAARSLAAADPAQLGSQLTSARRLALEEYEKAQRLDADRPHSHVNLALLTASMGRVAEAERHYRRALEVGPYFLPAYANLADLLRTVGRDAEGEELLRRAIEIEPNSAEIHHALGLLLVRARRADEALGLLTRASQLAPESERYAYVLGVALFSGGQLDRAIETLREAHDRHPSSTSILEGLASICREAGREEESLGYVEKLRALTEADRNGARRSDGAMAVP